MLERAVFGRQFLRHFDAWVAWGASTMSDGLWQQIDKRS